MNSGVIQGRRQGEVLVSEERICLPKNLAKINRNAPPIFEGQLNKVEISDAVSIAVNTVFQPRFWEISLSSKERQCYQGAFIRPSLLEIAVCVPSCFSRV